MRVRSSPNRQSVYDTYWRSALAAVVFLAGGTANAHDEQPPAKPLLGRLVDETEDVRDGAHATWHALSLADRMNLVRPALRGKDPGLAFVAAVIAPPEDLDLEELRLQSKALARDPLARHVPPPGLEGLVNGAPSFGSKDLLAIWTALTEREPDFEGGDFSRFHRSLLPEDVGALVPLLEKAKPRTFRALLEDLVMEADNEAKDGNHATYVRALRYGLARLRAEAKKRPRPRLADLAPPEAKKGLPAEFIELANAAWGEKGKDGFDLAGKPPQDTRGEGPWFWLHRWALRLEPAEEDVPFLLALIQTSRAMPQTRGWAARWIARLPGRAAGHSFDLVLASADAPAVYAAAERAARGEPEAWKRMADSEELWKKRETADALNAAGWVADRAAKRQLLWEGIRNDSPPDQLAEAERWFLEYDRGVVVNDEDLGWILDRMRTESVPLLTEAYLVTNVLPHLVTPEDATRIATSWTSRGQETVNPWEEITVRTAIAHIHARAPEAAVALLRSWAKPDQDASFRNGALTLLAKVGDASEVDGMRAAWSEKGLSPWIGRIKDARIEAFLRERANSAHSDTEAAAVQGLAIFQGCPEALTDYLDTPRSEDRAAWEAAKAMVLAKDSVGAALALTKDGPFHEGSLRSLAGFALTPDPRARARLEEWRDARGSGLYWPATAALALAGDERCRTEWRSFLGEARSFLLDDLLDGRLCTLDGNPEWVAFWVSRLDANCCHAWHAHEVVKATFPTFPYDHTPGGGGRTRAGAERWFARHAGTFVWSPILDGWLPGPKR